MQRLLAWVGVLAIASYVLKIDLKPFLSFLKLPSFNLPGSQQSQGQNQQSDGQIPQVTGPNQIPQSTQPSPIPMPSPGQNQSQNKWGIGFKGAITTPFGSTKNETNLGNPDFTQDENNGDQ